MYDVHNNLAPSNLKNMFKKLSFVHSYRTRSVTMTMNCISHPVEPCDKTRIIHLLENYRRTIDVSAISHGLHQETAESAIM